MELRAPPAEDVVPSFEIRERRDPDGTLILSVLGNLDFATAPELAERLAGATSRLWSLVLDLDAVEFMDSSGLSVLLAVTKRAREGGCSVSLARPHDGLLRLVRLTGLDAALPLRPAVRGPARSHGRRLLTWRRRRFVALPRTTTAPPATPEKLPRVRAGTGGQAPPAGPVWSARGSGPARSPRDAARFASGLPDQGSR
jgi:anti-sigma B factor antagonist